MSFAPQEINLPKTWATPFVIGEVKEGVSVMGAKKPVTTKTFECVGEWIQKSLWAAEVKKVIDASTRDAANGGRNAGDAAANKANKERRRTGGVKLKDEEIAEDYYAILGLEEAAVSHMSVDALRAAYRKKCVETHPDKQSDHSDLLFKKVGRGFEILSNEDSRRAYDSSRAFDDTIPGEAAVAEDQFYATFEPVFVRNVKFSLDLGLPVLGDENTPIEEVKKFYDAWYRFRSWRDFSSRCTKDLEEITEDMDRVEKRHHQKENQRLLDTHMKEEMRRIRNLVDRAHKSDPRVTRERDAELAAQEAIKAERNADRLRLREEAAKKQQEAADAEKRAAEDKVNKEKNEKETLKAHRQTLISFFDGKKILDKSASSALVEDEVKQKNINWLVAKSNSDQLAELLAVIQKTELPVLAFNDAVTAAEERVGQNRYGEAIKTAKQKADDEEKKKIAEAAAAVAAEKKKKGAVTWSDDELLHLHKAIAKYPGGSVDRWRRIVNFHPELMRFSEDNMLVKVKEIESGWRAGDISQMKIQKGPILGNKTDDADGWKDDPSAQAWAVGTMHPGGSLKGPSVAVVQKKPAFRPRLGRMLKKYCPEKLTMLDDMVAKYTDKEDDFMSALVKKFGPEPQPPAQAPAPTAGGAKATHADPTATPKAAAGGGVEDWTSNQQKQLEEGLRAEKGNKDKDKYVKVASHVEGKTAKQCFDRFKHLCALKK